METRGSSIAKNRSRRLLIRILGGALLFIIGFGAGVGVALFKMRSIGFRYLTEPTRGVLNSNLEVLGRIRTGDEPGALRLLEGSVFYAAGSISQSRGWTALSAEDRRALQLTRAYGEKIQWEHAEDARAKLERIDLEGLDLGTCNAGIRRFLESSP